MITVHAADAQPQFQATFHPDDAPPTPAVVLWDDPTVAVVGTVGDLRRLLSRALGTLPIIIDPESAP